VSSAKFLNFSESLFLRFVLRNSVLIIAVELNEMYIVSVRNDALGIPKHSHHESCVHGNTVKNPLLTAIFKKQFSEHCSYT
jgi:hypothetical protein